jgi:hypothetical protein
MFIRDRGGAEQKFRAAKCGDRGERTGERER